MSFVVAEFINILGEKGGGNAESNTASLVTKAILHCCLK